MNTNDLPVFAVSAVQPDSPQLKGVVNRWRWVGEGHIAYLYLRAGTFVEGKFRNVDEATKSASFAFKKPDAVPVIQPGESIRYLDGYWGERALISLDRSLDWRELTFRASKRSTREIWDHEHCGICWATIDQNENSTFMKSNEDDCICMDCFHESVEVRSIDFIEEV